ncbi:MAG: MaoC/PaaZ C-terminal domain-containing protein [Dehalococcoidia bacterium]|nr:MaoC/PaaZ C-terminal domain-containing protein [Dehalococcoidia bacterium]
MVSVKLPVGTELTSQSRTISEGELADLTNLTWTHSELHSSREFGKTTEFGERILAGPCVLAITVGLVIPDITALLRQHGMRTVALLGFNNVKFSAPLLPGDTVRAKAKLQDARESKSRPGFSVITWLETLARYDGTVLMEAQHIMMVRVAS